MTKVALLLTNLFDKSTSVHPPKWASEMKNGAADFNLIFGLGELNLVLQLCVATRVLGIRSAPFIRQSDPCWQLDLHPQPAIDV